MGLLKPTRYEPREKAARPHDQAGKLMPQFRATNSTQPTGRGSVTVLMPVYNESLTVQRAMDSLSRQSYKNFRAIISDNSSSDNTFALCELHAKGDSRFITVRQRTNLGAAGNFSYLMGLCDTEYFMMAAGHDEWDSDCLALLMEKIISAPECVLAYPATRIESIDGTTIADETFPPSFVGRSPLKRACAIVRQLIWCNMFYGVFRTDAFRQCRQDIRSIGPDHVLLMELALRGTILGVSAAHFTRHEPRAFPASEEEFHRSQLNRIYSNIPDDRQLRLRYWQWLHEHVKSAQHSATGVTSLWRAIKIAATFYHRFRPRLRDLV